MANFFAAQEFPRILALLTCIGGLVVGLFSFIFSCIIRSPSNIMLTMVIIGGAIVLLLGALRVLSVLQTNIPLMILLALFCMILSFIVFVNYCILARGYSAGSYFGVSIVIILLSLGMMVVYAIFIVVLIKHHEQQTLTAGTSSTTVTSSKTITTTNIETPPANYVVQPVS